MRPSSSSREMQTMNSLLNHHDHQPQLFQMSFDPSSSHDDFLEQMLSTVNNPSSSTWPDLSNPNPNPSPDDQPPHNNVIHLNHHQQQQQQQQYHFDDQSPALLASKLRQHQINCVGAPSPASAKALLLSRSLAGNGLIRSPSGGDNGLLNNNLNLIDGSFKPTNNPANDSTVQALYNGFAGSLSQTANQSPHFNQPQTHNFGAAASPAMKQAAAPSGSTGGSGGGGSGVPSAQPRQQRVRARRGQATDPHSIAERLRRERIAERMKALQELVPNANKTDKASMLDEIIDYVKFLQLQVKVLSMSRLGGAAAVAPQAGGDGGRASGTRTASSSNNDNTMMVAEHQVAKLMEEDMGSAMQYLQGRGLCLMPISLATAISTATSHSRKSMNPKNPLRGANGGDAGGPTSPSMSVLTVQSATMGNGAVEPAVKDAASVSKS